MRVILLVAFLMGLAGPVSAGDMNAFVSLLKHENPSFRVRLNGIEKGLSAANAELILTGRRPLYCQPSKMAITVEQASDILKRYVDRHPLIGKMDIGGANSVFLRAMQDTFPCPK